MSRVREVSSGIGRIVALFVATALVASLAGPAIGAIGPTDGESSLAGGQVRASVSGFGTVETEQRGDVVDIPVTGLSGSDYVTVTLGTPGEGYASNVTARDDDGDGRVVLRWNSYTADEGQTLEDGTWTAAGGDTVVNQDVRTAIADGPGHVIAPGTYDLAATAGRMRDGAAAAPPDALDTLTLDRRATEGVTLWTADESVADRISTASDIARLAGEEVTQADTVAEGDLVIVQVDASGLEGVFESQGTSDPREQFYGAVEAGAVTLNHTRTDAANPNAPQNTLEVSDWETGDGVRVVMADDRDTYFVIHDTGQSDFFDPEEGFETAFTVHSVRESAASYGLVAPEGGSFSDEVALAGFDVLAPEIQINTAVSGAAEVQDAPGEAITGTTTLAPGSTLEFRLETKDNQPSPFLLTGQTTVRADGTWAKSFDFGSYQEGTEFTVDVSHAGGAVTATADGLVAESPTVETLVFDDQRSRGELVTVGAAQLSEGGFVAIHEGSPLGPVLGVSGHLDPGEPSSDIRIPLEDPLNTDAALFATAHLDSNYDGQFDYVTSDGARDGPYQDGNSPVSREATVQVTTGESTATPTETATPEPTETPTRTPIETRSPTETPEPPGTVETFLVDEQREGSDAVTVAAVELSEGGFVAVHRESASGRVVAVSDYLAAGDRNTDLSIPLEDPIREDAALVAVPHYDTNENREFDYAGPGSEDGPYPGGGERVPVQVTTPTPAPAGAGGSGGDLGLLPILLLGLVGLGGIGAGAYWLYGRSDDDPHEIVGPDDDHPPAAGAEPAEGSPRGPPGETPPAEGRPVDTTGPESTGETAADRPAGDPAAGADAGAGIDGTPAAEPGDADAPTERPAAESPTEEPPAGEPPTEEPPTEGPSAEGSAADPAGGGPEDQGTEEPDEAPRAGDEGPSEGGPSSERPGPGDASAGGEPAAGPAPQLAREVDTLADVAIEHSGPALATYSATLLGGGVDPDAPAQVVALAPEVDADEATVDVFERIAGKWYDAGTHSSARTVYDWGTDPLPWIAVEPLPGSQQITAAAEQFTAEQTASVIAGAADAVAAAPGNHLDVSPNCIEVIQGESGPLAVVGDWGLERAIRDALGQEHVTAYTAPEQLDGEMAADARADVYALGAVAYHALTGRPPVRPSAAEIRQGEITHVNELVRIPAAVDVAIMHALSTDPEDRHASPADFAAALRDSI